MKIAVEGCCHGELDTIYAAMQRLEAKEGVQIDLLICCGDFQAVRNEDDLACMSVPDKYKVLGTFYKYYTGEAVAPYPTLFIGGNHEACNYLWELYYGGWVCPNIYFMGYSGVVRFGELRVAGLSGIWKPGDYRRGYSERPPYSASDVKSAYHCREYDVWKLRQVAEPLDVFVSHDWPRGVAAHGDMAQLMRSKPFLKAELQDGSLGSQPAAELLAQLQPDYWFSAHLHCKFPALVPRRGARPGATRFLALDKCLPKRDFLQVIDLPNRQAGPFAYDEEWLAIVSASHAAMPLSRAPASLPGGGRGPAPGRDAARAAVAAALAARGGADVPLNFERTARAHDPAQPRRASMPTSTPRNPQTCALLDILQLDYKLDAPVPQQPPPQQWQQQQPAMQWGGPLPPPPALSVNPEEIDLGDAQEANPEEVELPE